MLKGYRSDPETTELINKFDWFILPSANPDGYEYTHTGVSHPHIHTHTDTQG